MDHAVEIVRGAVDVPILTQRDLPKPALVKAFSDSEETCLFATTGMFQGVDVPGRTLSLVAIDKLPFPRPDDPLLSARREQLGASAFGEIDVPRASTLLAQACGRLIRNMDDRGVVAVLDPRLGTARYRWDIVKSLPPMKRTRERAEVEAFLREITSTPD
jgi:ATP-dependent DNA helicase DinG